MLEINKVLICGIGAIGSIYANKINKYSPNNLRILVDKDRLEKYIKSPKIFNGKELKLNYILPEVENYKADLIIIATKYDGLADSIKNIKNFVKDDTIIISLLNGINSEEIIAREYGKEHILPAYFIGHSAMRKGNIISHDGVGVIVFGGNNYDVNLVKTYFDKVGIDYKIPDDIKRSMWLKFMLNVSSNQTSAILNMTFGQMQQNVRYRKIIKNIMQEVLLVGKACGLSNTDNMIQEAFESFDKMIPNGKTSMLQDVLSKRKTEGDMFAGTVIELGKKYNIPTPYNNILYEFIKIIESNYDNL